MAVKVDDLFIRGHKVPVYVNEEGMFYATIDEEYISRESLAKLKASLGSLLAKDPINIPFICIREDHNGKEKVHKGVIVGVHSSNRNIIVRMEGDTSNKQLSRWGYRYGILKVDTDVRELQRLKKQVRDADSKLKKFIASNTLDVESIQRGE